MGQISVDVKPEGHSAYVRRSKRLASSNSSSLTVSGSGAEGREATRQPGPGEPLGNNTKSRAAFEVRELENPDSIQRFSVSDARREPVREITADEAATVGRQARFSAQASATKLLFNQVTTRDTQWRVTGCTRRKISTEVTILHSAKLGRAHYGNLMICGSVWTCPPCAAKISEGRKQEIKIATDAHQAAGGALYMITHTFAHTREEDIDGLLARFSPARQWMRQHRAYKALRRDMGYVGDIRTLEVTYGDSNGWHPHEHGLWFVADFLTRSQLRRMASVLFDLWSRACFKFGLGAPNRKRGVNIIHCQSAADYMAKMGREQKWGIASELSKQHIKSGQASSMSPFDLLRSYENGNKQHGVFFIAYARAFFGKRQILWSDGLKAIFGIFIQDDQDLAEEQLAPDSINVMQLDAYEWRVVLSQPFDVRALVLQLAESGYKSGIGVDGVRLFIDSLVSRSPLIPF